MRVCACFSHLLFLQTVYCMEHTEYVMWSFFCVWKKKKKNLNHLNGRFAECRWQNLHKAFINIPLNADKTPHKPVYKCYVMCVLTLPDCFKLFVKLSNFKGNSDIERYQMANKKIPFKYTRPVEDWLQEKGNSSTRLLECFSLYFLFLFPVIPSACSPSDPWEWIINPLNLLFI